MYTDHSSFSRSSLTRWFVADALTWHFLFDGTTYIHRYMTSWLCADSSEDVQVATVLRVSSETTGLTWINVYKNILNRGWLGSDLAVESTIFAFWYGIVNYVGFMFMFMTSQFSYENAVPDVEWIIQTLFLDVDGEFHLNYRWYIDIHGPSMTDFVNVYH